MAVQLVQTRSQPWVIAQLEPPNGVLRLEGSAAPHGRRRKNPLMETEFELRMQVTRYAGRRKPARHHFGDKESDIILNGRFMDTDLGAGGAIDKRREVREFAAQARPIRVRWGSVISYQGIIAKFRSGIEDAANVRYELTIEVDADEDLVTRRPFLAPPVPPEAVAVEINEQLRFIRAPLETGDELNFGFLQDAIEKMASVVSQLNTASATFLNAATAIKDFSSAGAGQLKRLLGGITQLKTAMIDMQNVYSSLTTDAVLFALTAESLASWDVMRLSSDLSIVRSLSFLADLEKDTRNAIGSPGFALVIARDGDTWEAMATRSLGGPSGAATLRDANGVRYGEQPVGGRSYIVPTS